MKGGGGERERERKRERENVVMGIKVLIFLSHQSHEARSSEGIPQFDCFISAP